MGIVSGLRAVARLSVICALCLPLGVAQILVVGPVFKNRDRLPGIMSRIVLRFSGIKLLFNGAAQAQAPGRPVMYISNHISYLDPIVMAAFLRGAFVSKAETGTWPVIGHFCRSIGTVFTYRSKEDIPRTQAAILGALNEGRSIVFYPEGTVTDGADVLPFKTGILGVMFNNVSGVALQKDVIVQPYAMKVTHVDGQSVAAAPDLRKAFVWTGPETMAPHFWRLLRHKSVHVEFTALPALDPKNYTDRKDFAESARQSVRQGLGLSGN